MKFYIIVSFLCLSLIGIASCKSNKIPCPTYANSLPEKKKKVKPGEQKPEIAKLTKTKSGVMPPKH